MSASGVREGTRSTRRRWRRLLAWALLLAWGGVSLWHTQKPMPPGTAVHSPAVAATEVAFLTDLTAARTADAPLHEQSIFDEVFRLVDEAHSFIVADFFLFNDGMGAAGNPHRALSRQLAERLIARKAARPSLQVVFVTDPINEVYGGAVSPALDALRGAGIDVVMTDLGRLRDPNPLYTAGWRLFGQWWGNAPHGGRLPNPFDTGGPPVTLRSWLHLLNFKANHRKLLVADRADGSLAGLVTSANPHDASSAHSNVALRFGGELGRHIVASEIAIARLSGWQGRIDLPPPAPAPVNDRAIELAFVTEQRIRDHLLDAVALAGTGDAVRIATFYLADRGVIEALLAAAARGAEVRVVLDPNRDAFGRRKDGVPNRPVAHELVARSGGRIAVRWYRTHGEQFHTKLALVTHGERLVASLGSANLTRRNIGGYNLEANVAVATAATTPLARAMTAYFERLWTNPEAPAIEYTTAFATWRDASALRYWRYRLMEATGLSTF
jgi:phosphatidylserine/phosphatidylglycerophosphate/cardiolipin synthase-like enzyme